MSILVVGASGFVGRNLVAALTAAGFQVKPVSRRHGVDVSRWVNPSDWLPLLAGCTGVVNALGIIGERGGQRFWPLHYQVPNALFNACVASGVLKVVHISALGADEGAASAYHLSKRAADEALLRLPLQASVLRPSLVYGPGGDSTRLLCRLARCPIIPLAGDGLYPVQPVHVSDLIAAVVRALQAPVPTGVLNVVGPKAYSFKDWLQTLRAGMGLAPAPCLQVPWVLAMAGARFGRYLSPILSPDNLNMLARGNSAPVEPLQAWLGRSPIGFSAQALQATTP